MSLLEQHLAALRDEAGAGAVPAPGLSVLGQNLVEMSLRGEPA